MTFWRRSLCVLFGHRSHTLFWPDLELAGEACRRCGWLCFCDCQDCVARLRSLDRMTCRRPL